MHGKREYLPVCFVDHLPSAGTGPGGAMHRPGAAPGPLDFSGCSVGFWATLMPWPCEVVERVLRSVEPVCEEAWAMLGHLDTVVFHGGSRMGFAIGSDFHTDRGVTRAASLPGYQPPKRPAAPQGKSPMEVVDERVARNAGASWPASCRTRSCACAWLP